MKIKPYFRISVLFILLGAGISLSSCTRDSADKEQGFSLHYPAITNTAPGKYFSLTPSWYGATPSDFSIVSIIHDGSQIQSECFVIDASTGEFKLTGTENLAVGMYNVSVSCLVSGQLKSFPNIISIEILKPVPEGIAMNPSSLSVSLEDIASGEETGLPTSQLTTEADSHVSVESYSIANVYIDGSLANEKLSWFEISDEGVFSIVPGNEDFVSGTYTFDFRLTTYFVNENSEDGLFTNALTLKVTSPPYSLEYTPNYQKVEQNYSVASSYPVIKGSPDGLAFSVESVSVNGETVSGSGISIDSRTGVLTFPESSSTEVGDIYMVSVKAENDFGTTVFSEAYRFEIIEFIAPITEFSYPDVPRKLSGAPIEVSPQKMNGTEVVYSFVDLPEDLAGLRLTEDGAICNDKGNEFPHGTYQVTVRAENIKGYKDAILELDIANFTYICWGNNLGENGAMLTPRERYTNQFRLNAATPKTEPLVFVFADAVHDIPEGYDVEYSINTLRTSGISLESDTQNLMIISAKVSTDILIADVTVSVSDQEYTITRHIPIFVDRYDEGTCEVLCTPFVFRVNPKSGGTSDMSITNVDGNPVSSDYKTEFSRYFYYYNIGGPDWHTNPNRVNITEKPETGVLKPAFICQLWENWATSTNGKYDRYKDYPVSYSYNKDAGTLDKALLYFDAQLQQIRVNPEKFKDNDGIYADGIAVSTKDGSSTPRFCVWFDPDYQETVTE